MQEDSVIYNEGYGEYVTITKELKFEINGKNGQPKEYDLKLYNSEGGEPTYSIHRDHTSHSVALISEDEFVRFGITLAENTDSGQEVTTMFYFL